ncbi:MAG: 50S ribosomal protein L17 [Candidatus Omnitrophica bacterium]|nr:50S ribosomal protein L17 [Candidatus Omnitrophota bacterium]MDD5429134.1 50S ribosomal protein L17 [Candidatus Omnitrophota bacterium]
MRHRKKSEKLSRSCSQRKALVRSLLRAVVINERIITTTSKAKYLRGRTDELITLAKKASLSAKRSAYRLLQDHKLVTRLFEVLGPKYKSVQGGYTRVLNLGPRKGDGANLSILEFTKMTPKAKPLQDKQSSKHSKISEKSQVKKAPKKEVKPKKGIMSGMKKIFKKERDSL